MTGLDLADGLRLIHAAKGDERLGHEAHLRFGWSLLQEAADVEEAEHVAKLTIRHASEMVGSPGKYNCTVTVFWIRMLDHVRHQAGVSTLEQALEAEPSLSDPHLPDRHWSDVNDEVAKREWIEPDLLPMP